MKEESSFRELLSKILLEKFTHARPSLKVCEYSLKYQEAEEAIIELVESVVPDEMKRWDKSQQMGWNSCRQEILTRIKL